MNTFDQIIKNGTILDGRRTSGTRSDIGIRGERIAQVGDLAAAEAAQVIDASGQIVCPGFIDVHTHSDAWLLEQPISYPKHRKAIRQNS